MLATDDRPQDCVPCQAEHIDAAGIVFRDGLWACEVLTGWEVPGFYVLRVRRHAEQITSLNDAELAGYARRLQDMVAAVREVTGAPTAYILTFGELNPHFHTLIAARGDDIPPERRFGAILEQRLDQIDHEAAYRLVPEVAAAYERRR